jgi:hypothetical protein
MTSKQQLLDDLMGIRAQLADDGHPCRVFMEDMIWSAREAMAWEQYGHSVADWWKQFGLRTGDSTAFH